MVDFTEEYARGLLRGIAQFAHFHGHWAFCRIPLAHRQAVGIRSVLSWAKKWGAKAMIAQVRNVKEAEEIRSSGIIVIAQDYKMRFPKLRNITGDYIRTGKMAAEHFLERGFRHFAFLGFKDIVWSSERAEGFAQRISEAGYITNSYMRPRSNMLYFWDYNLSLLTHWIESLPKPVGLMACDDNQAQQVSEACQIAGFKVPDDVAIIGVDNDEMICRLSNPPLSSIVLNTERGGYEAARALYNIISGEKKEASDIVVHPLHVVTRQSTDLLAIDDKYVTGALRYIRSNYREKIQVPDVVKTVPLSRRVLEKRFSQVLGRSILKEINHVRIEQFSRLLLETNLTISQISNDLGYPNIKNISRNFRQEKGLTPSAYRRILSKR